MTVFFSSENIASGKPTWQQFPFSVSFWGAELAVDGDYTDLTAGGGQCVISAGGKTTAEWRVDLEAILSIHHIVIHYRTDGKNWGKNR